MTLKKEDDLRINLTLHGRIASWAREIKSPGIARSNSDLVYQAIACFYDKIVDARLKVARLKTLEKAAEEE